MRAELLARGRLGSPSPTITEVLRARYPALRPPPRNPKRASGVCRPSPITMPSPSSEAHQRSAPEVRVLPCTGVARPQQYYDPVRIPLTPPPRATLRPLPPCRTGLPRLPEPPFQCAVPTTPADRMGAGVDCFPIHTAFPVMQAGRHPHHHFRGLLRLHSRYGPLDRSTAQGGLCHEASTRSVTRPSRSSATEAIGNSPGEIFLHWWFAPSGRTA